MKKKSKGIIIAIVVIIIISFALLGGVLGSGNNGYAQKYEFDINSVTLIRAVKTLKATNTIFNPPSNIYDPDTLDKSTNHYNIEIYSKKASASFAFFIESNANKATLYLVSINKGVDYREWKTINHDLNQEENMNAKKTFEQDILNRLDLKYQSAGNSMFIFWK